MVFILRFPSSLRPFIFARFPFPDPPPVFRSFHFLPSFLLYSLAISRNSSSPGYPLALSFSYLSTPIIFQPPSTKFGVSYRFSSFHPFSLVPIYSCKPDSIHSLFPFRHIPSLFFSLVYPFSILPRALHFHSSFHPYSMPMPHPSSVSFSC